MDPSTTKRKRLTYSPGPVASRPRFSGYSPPELESHTERARLEGYSPPELERYTERARLEGYSPPELEIRLPNGHWVDSYDPVFLDTLGPPFWLSQA